MDYEENVGNQEGELYVVGTRGYSAYEVAVLNGYEGTEEEWLESLVGPQGPQGEQGEQGDVGPVGPAPNFNVGSVTTGEPGTNAEVSITGTPENKLLNFTIPKGAKGDKGDTGTLNYNDVENKPSINSVSLQGNRSLDDLGIQAKGNYVTQTEIANYVTKTDYPNGNNAGVIKLDTNMYGLMVSSGVLIPVSIEYATYLNKGISYSISKGTLENVITGKGLTTKSYVDGLVGDINDALDAINGEVI